MIEALRVLAGNWKLWILALLAVGALVRAWQLARRERIGGSTSWRNRIGALALLVLAAAAGLGLWMTLAPGIGYLAELRQLDGLIGKPAPELTLRQVADDAPVRLADLRGRVVVLNLWATWCEPCREEMPALDRLQTSAAGRGLQVVTVSDEEPGTLRKFADEHPLRTLNVYMPKGLALSLHSRPLFLLIDRHGIVRRALIGGPRTAEELAALVRPYLKA